MGNRVIKVERTLQLAKQLMQDIKQRDLRSGDSYYTTMEAADFLGVAGATANRALQLLEKRGVLYRRQKRGAVILSPSETPPVIDHVHFVLRQRLSLMGDYGEGIVEGIRDELPQSHISYTVPDSRNETETVGALLDEAKKDGGTHGFIMCSVSPTVQKIIGNSGFPRVLLGTKCPGSPPMSQIDINQESALRILVDHLHQRQCRKIALVLRRDILPGDITLVNTAIRLGIPNCFFLQHAEDDPDCIDELCELIQTQFEPDGIVCLSSGQAIVFQKTLAKLGKPPEKTEMTVIYHRGLGNVPRFTHTTPQLPAPVQGRRLGNLLVDSALGFKPKKEVVPVELVLQDEMASPSPFSYPLPFVTREASNGSKASKTEKPNDE